MSNAATPSNARRWRSDALLLQVTVYDRVASMLLALLALVGISVACLLLVWLSNRLLVVQRAVPVTLQPLGGGAEWGELLGSMQLESPSPEEVAAQADLEIPEFRQMVAAVAEAVALRRADLVDPALEDNSPAARGGRSQGTGSVVGYGEPGDGSGNRPQRWEIEFAQGATLDLYARQLDHFGIELGAISVTSQIVYAANFSSPAPSRRVGRRADEQRLYMAWRDGALKEADRRLLTRAGVDVAGKVVVQFFPPELEQRLAALEQQFADRQPRSIRKTRFGVRASPAGFEFYVIEQTAW